MNTKTIVIISVVAAFALVGLICLVSGISIYNAQSSLKNTYEMKVEANKTDFDNMFKKIQQVAEVAEAKKDGLRDIYTSNSDSRTSEGQGRMMAWIKEAVPNADLSIYDNVLNIIVGSRDSWTSRQKELVDIAREHNQNLVVFPKNLLLGMFGFKRIDPLIVTSGRTEKAFETRKDEVGDVFNKKK